MKVKTASYGRRAGHRLLPTPNRAERASADRDTPAIQYFVRKRWIGHGMLFVRQRKTSIEDLSTKPGAGLVLISAGNGSCWNG